MIIDASALVDRLLGVGEAARAVAEEMRGAVSVHTLDFAHLEVISALRRDVARRELTAKRAEQALDDLSTAPVIRHPAAPLADRIWELRHNHTPYDAAYVALAEALAMPLLTTDSRLARSTGHRAQIVEAGAIE